MCKNLTIKVIYVTQYIHAATGLVERGIKTLKDLIVTKVADNCNLNQALYRSLTVMRTPVHSKIKETPFERHYDRKPRTELTSYLGLPSNVISAKTETFQIFTFTSKDGDNEQLVMKTLHKLKCDVSNNFRYNFPEKKTKQQVRKQIRNNTTNSSCLFKTYKNYGHEKKYTVN